MVFGKHFNKYYKKYGLLLLLGVIVLAILDWVQLYIPQTVNQIITGVDENGEGINFILHNIFRILIFASIITLGRFLWRHLLFGSSRRIETDIREAMFIHSTKLSHNYYSGEKIGGLMSYFTNDLEAVRQSFGMGILMITDGTFLLVMVLYRMININLMLTLYAFIPLFLIGIVLFLARKKGEYKFKIRQEKVEGLSDYTQESFSGYSVIKAYTKEIASALVFDRYNKELKEASFGFVKYMVIINVLIDLFLFLVVAALLVFGNYLILEGNLNAGTLLEYVSYFFMLLWPIQAISQFVFIHGQSNASAKRIASFLDEEEVKTFTKGDGIIIDKLEGEIKLNNLTFNYPDDDRDVLKNISLTIKSGETIGVLGRTGSGKSSLVELLLKVYEARDDSILIDNMSINEIETTSLRSHIGYVPQNNFLYSMSIKENIAFGSDTLDEEKVIEAAKMADLYNNIIDFNEGFDTIIGERGVTLSGGQRQRLSIARALYNDPAILILDDSVSAVDVDTEHEIISNLKRVRKGRTTILIAHRVSTVKSLDKIILLDDGAVIGFDTHENLMNNNKTYRNLVKLQSLDDLYDGFEVN